MTDAELLAAIRAIIREELAVRQGQTTTRAPAQTIPASSPTTAGGNRNASNDVFKFGRSKGTPLASGSVKDLRWYGDFLQRGLDDPSKARFRDENVRDIALINGLLASHHEAPIEGSEPTRGGQSADPTAGWDTGPAFDERPPPDTEPPFITSAGIR